MRLRASLLAATTVVASLAVVAPPAVGAGPVCVDPVPRELCGGRVFAEPLQSLTGLTYAQLLDGLQALEDEFPEWVAFDTFGGSADGRDLVVVEVTAPTSTVPYEDRKVVLVNQSIHGNEPGGREGAPRYLEDLLRGGDPARTELLDRVRLVQTFINPDGWTAGDHDALPDDGDSLGLWARGNGSSLGVSDVGGTDLNRQAPWRGLIPEGRDPVSEPESIAFEQFVRELAATSDIQASLDIHGEVPDAAAVIMLSSGQFDLDGAMNQRVQGDALVDATFAALEDSQVDQFIQLFGAYPAAILHASSEFGAVNSGGSGSGFQGDWIAQPEGGDSASLSTVELYNFAGTPGVNSLTARREVMQLYRDTVRGLLGGLLDQAALEHDATLLTDAPVAWVDDLARVADPVREGVLVSGADLFTDLAAQLPAGLVRLTPAELAAGALTEPVAGTAVPAGADEDAADEDGGADVPSERGATRREEATAGARRGAGLPDQAGGPGTGDDDGGDDGDGDGDGGGDEPDPGVAPGTVVLATDGIAEDPAAVAAVRSFAEEGGTVVLTDAAVGLVPQLVDGVAAEDVGVTASDIGLNVYDRAHPLAAGIREIAYMNVEAATMGYEVTGAGDVPVWHVTDAAWAAAGGTVAARASTDATGPVSVGEVPVGAGVVRTIGLLAPPPQADGRILYGINGYGALDTGFIVLANALGGELVVDTSPAVPGTVPVGTVTTAAATPAPPVGDAARTALLVALLGVLLGVAAASSVRRRARG